MCELTNGKIFVADRDIDCYKIVKRKIEFYNEESGKTFDQILVPAVFQAMPQYEIGQVYRLVNFDKRCINRDVVTVWVFKKNDFTWYKVTISVEQYRMLFSQILMCDTSGFNYSPYGACRVIHNEEDLIQTARGYYSYTHYMNGKMEKDLEWYNAMGDGDYVAVKCTIPEGSKYIVSENGECFVSESIVINRVID